jgi:hypothetical protein
MKNNKQELAYWIIGTGIIYLLLSILSIIMVFSGGRMLEPPWYIVLIAQTGRIMLIILGWPVIFIGKHLSFIGKHLSFVSIPYFGYVWILLHGSIMGSIIYFIKSGIAKKIK